MNENDVAAESLRKTIQPAFYRRVENLLGSGTPDTYVCIDGISAWIEVKYCRKLPARATTGVFKNSTRPLAVEQENWLIAHCMHGGRCFIFARVVDWFVLVPGHCADSFNGYTIEQLRRFEVNLDFLRVAIVTEPVTKRR